MGAELDRIREQLAEKRQAHAELRRQGASLVARLRSASSRVVSTCVKELDEDLERYYRDIEPASPAALAPWTSPAWTTYPDNVVSATPLSLRVGFETEGTYSTERAAQIPRMARLVDAHGALIFLCDSATQKIARDLILNLLTRAALAAPEQVRFSLIDPIDIGGAFPIHSLLPNVRTSQRTPTDDFELIARDIQRLNQTVVRMSARLADLPPLERAAEPFEIIAVMDYPEAYSRDPRATDYILRIANAGPKAGKHLLLEYRSDKEPPRDISLDKFSAAQIFDCAKLGFTSDSFPQADKLIHRLLVACSAKIKQASAGGWDRVVRPIQFFAESSQDKIETKLGELLLFRLDNECSHAILAGQNGSGKSSLLHVLITGLAARYSPEELQFVLVDGKDGVEFRAYERLPHANIVCLRTPPHTALSVLEEYRDEMKYRYKLFGENNAVDLIGYRKTTGRVLPRQIMIVDEYRVLLEADSVKGAECLGVLLEKGRAAGIHLLLASQDFEVKQMPSGFQQHIRLRASLRLDPKVVASLGAMFDAEGKQMIRDISASGQLVINQDNGRDAANVRGAVARLEPSDNPPQAVAKLVEEITAAVRGKDHQTALHEPIVLHGDDRAELATNPFIQQWRTCPPDPSMLQNTARITVKEGGFGMPGWSSGDQPIPFWLGRKFDVRGHALAVLRRLPNQNLLSIGSETLFRLSMLANTLAGLRSMLAMDNFEFILLDGLEDGLPGAGLLSAGLEFLEMAGARVTRLSRHSSISPPLELLANSYANLKGVRGSRLLIISEPEYFPDLHGGGAYGSAPAGAPRAFFELLRNGPRSGTHVIVTTSSVATLSSILLLNRDKSLFQHRVVQQISQEDSGKLFDSLSATRVLSQANHVTAALYVDAVQGSQLFKSYCTSARSNGDETAEGLREALSKIYKPAARGQAS